MSRPSEKQGNTARVSMGAHFATVLLHGRRFEAHRRENHPYDILTEGGGQHVASIYGHESHGTDENAACLAASAEMLTALVDLVTAHDRGRSPGSPDRLFKTVR